MLVPKLNYTVVMTIPGKDGEADKAQEMTYEKFISVAAPRCTTAARVKALFEAKDLMLKGEIAEGHPIALKPMRFYIKELHNAKQS